jgi:two-component system CheB/CheR fusion protein
VRGVEAIAERPDGTRVPFLPYPTPLRDATGQLVGAINLLVDLTERRRAEVESAQLAAIVASSDDAIISKTLEGRVTSWNEGASRIFGWEASEMIGQPILRIIPPELHDEEVEILARLRRGAAFDAAHERGFIETEDPVVTRASDVISGVAINLRQVRARP